jgi:hypothetical protein
MSVTDGPNLGKMIDAVTGDTFDAEFRTFLRAVDVLLQLAVISKTIAAPPGSPANGDRYIVGASPSGAWAGQANKIAVWSTDNPVAPSGEWEFYTPRFGWIAPNLADGLTYVYSGSAWVALSSGGGGSSTLAADTDVAIVSPTNGQVLAFDTASGKWKNAASGGGGGGGGTYPVAGTPIIAGNRGTATVNGFNNYTIWAQLCGNKLRHLAATWKVVIAAVGGTGVSIAKAVVLKTLPLSLVPLSSTPILFGGAASTVVAFGTTPTVTAPAFITSDPIALQLDADHDYWIAFFFDNDGGGKNAALVSFSNPVAGEMFGMYQGSGDHTTDNPIAQTPYNTTAPLYWDIVFAS